MRPLQMVDLKSQYEKIKPEIDAAIATTLQNTSFIGGPQVTGFASRLQDYLDVKHVIPCANGTDALQISLMALGLKPGDEVITPSFTFVATTEVIALLGLQPVFVEVDAETFCMDVESLKKAISPKTKAIIPVHLYGQAAPMEDILEIAREHKLFVIEDNAQAIGATYTFSNGQSQKTGTMGDVGCTSFFPSKNLGCYGDGGAMCTNDDELAVKLKMIANHGMQRRYYHEMVGCNSRLDALQAAILNVKLPRLDEYNRARLDVADRYDQGFFGNEKLRVPKRAPYSTHVFHQYTLVLNDVDREGLIAWLGEHDIPCMIYYPVPCHRQDMFKAFGGAEFDLPVTDWLTERVISLPIHTEMDEEQQAFIIAKVLEFVNKSL